MTANAFTSVSLDPPLVLVSIDHRTRMHRMLPDTRRFGVSVLASPTRSGSPWHFAGRPLRDPGELFDVGPATCRSSAARSPTSAARL